MKLIAAAICATTILASNALVADAKWFHKSDNDKTKIALKLEASIAKELVRASQTTDLVPGVGTDYTFEWSGGDPHTLLF